MNTKNIRDKILEHLMADTYFEGMVTAEEINGNNFSAIDIALPKDKKVNVFRLMLIKHG